MSLFEDFALGLITNLLSGIVQENAQFQGISYLERRRIMRRVEDATAEVVTPLLPYLQQEGISEAQQYRFIETCIAELQPFTQKPEALFTGSLDGQKVFDRLYATQPLPEVVVEDGLKGLYTQLFPSIATVICKIPAAVRDWEHEAWAENYRRLDVITAEIKAVFSRVEAIEANPIVAGDKILELVRKTLTQKIGLALDLTSLGSETPVSGKFDDLFIHPEFEQAVDTANPRSPNLTTPLETLEYVTRPHHNTIIVGPPGSGKSTWTQWLQRELLKPPCQGFALRIELRQIFREPLPSLHSLIRMSVGPHLSEDLTSERVAQWLNAHRITFIFDGFDEIGPAQRDNVLQWIRDLDFAIRGCPMVITSRPLTTNHLEQLGQAWTLFMVQAFDQERILEYIRRWYTYTPLLTRPQRPVDAQKLASTWVRDPALGPLTGNPLLLSTLLMVHHMDGRLPEGRSQLYKRYIEGMLGIWDNRRHIVSHDQSLTISNKHRILQAIALRLFLSHREVIDEPNLLEWLKIYLNPQTEVSGEHVLATLRERTGLLTGPGVYGFVHKSIAEYLVAEAILQGDQWDEEEKRIDRLRLLNHRHDDHWNSVIFLWAGLATIQDVESFVQTCLETDAWELGGGLLLDQYQRFPMPIRQKLLRLLLAKDIEVDTDLDAEEFYHYTWHCAGPWEEFTEDEDGASPIRINMPMVQLRGLTHRNWYNGATRLEHLLDQAVRDRTLSLESLDSNKPHLYRLLWPTFLLSTFDEAIITAVLRLPPPSGPLPQKWYSLIASWIVRGVLDGNALPLESYLRASQDVLPEIAELLPLMLVAEFLELWSHGWLREDYTHEVEKTTLILRALASCQKVKVSTIQLANTHSWGIPDTLLRNFDLLHEFVEKVEELRNNQILPQSQDMDIADQYVYHLMRRRRAQTS